MGGVISAQWVCLAGRLTLPPQSSRLTYLPRYTSLGPACCYPAMRVRITLQSVLGHGRLPTSRLLPATMHPAAKVRSTVPSPCPKLFRIRVTTSPAALLGSDSFHLSTSRIAPADSLSSAWQRSHVHWWLQHTERARQATVPKAATRVLTSPRSDSSLIGLEGPLVADDADNEKSIRGRIDNFKEAVRRYYHH